MVCNMLPTNVRQVMDRQVSPLPWVPMFLHSQWFGSLILCVAECIAFNKPESQIQNPAINKKQPVAYKRCRWIGPSGCLWMGARSPHPALGGMKIGTQTKWKYLESNVFNVMINSLTSNKKPATLQTLITLVLWQHVWLGVIVGFFVLSLFWALSFFPYFFSNGINIEILWSIITNGVRLLIPLKQKNSNVCL